MFTLALPFKSISKCKLSSSANSNTDNKVIKIPKVCRWDLRTYYKIDETAGIVEIDEMNKIDKTVKTDQIDQINQTDNIDLIKQMDQMANRPIDQIDLKH